MIRVGEVGDIVPLAGNGTGGQRGIGLEQGTAGTLPAELGHMATANFVDTTGLGGVVGVNQSSDQGNDPVGLEVLKDIRGHNGGRHAAGGDRSNDVGNNVVFGTLLGEGLCETDLAKFGGGVVGLAKVAEQTGGGSSIDNTAILLLPEVRPRGSRALSGQYLPIHNVSIIEHTL